MYSIAPVALALAVSVILAGNTMSGPCTSRVFPLANHLPPATQADGSAGALNAKVWALVPNRPLEARGHPFGYVWKPNVPAGRYDMLIRLKVEPTAIRQPILEYYLQGVPAAGRDLRGQIWTHHLPPGDAFVEFRLPLVKQSGDDSEISWKLDDLGAVRGQVDSIAFEPVKIASRVDVTFGEAVKIPVDGTYLPDPGTRRWATNYFLGADGGLILNAHRSTDEGKTWQPVVNGPPTSGDGCIGRLRDGTLMLIGGREWNSRPDLKGLGHYEAITWRSADAGRSWQGPTPAPMTLPVEREGNSWEDDAEYQRIQIFHHDLMELPDGSLLANMYGSFRSPDWPDTGGSSEQKFKYRTYLIRSTDGGKSWAFHADVAVDPTLGADGPCEAGMVRLANGRILCVMRTGSANPLYMNHSDDDGRTWSTPRALPYTGVAPYLVLMKNGVLALSYGRPGCSIAFDPTGTGDHWGMPVNIPGSESSVGYTCIREIRPGVLFYTHGTDDKTSVRGISITVNQP